MSGKGRKVIIRFRIRNRLEFEPNKIGHYQKRKDMSMNRPTELKRLLMAAKNNGLNPLDELRKAVISTCRDKPLTWIAYNDGTLCLKRGENLRRCTELAPLFENYFDLTSIIRGSDGLLIATGRRDNIALVAPIGIWTSYDGLLWIPTTFEGQVIQARFNDHYYAALVSFGDRTALTYSSDGLHWSEATVLAPISYDQLFWAGRWIISSSDPEADPMCGFACKDDKNEDQISFRLIPAVIKIIKQPLKFGDYWVTLGHFVDESAEYTIPVLSTDGLVWKRINLDAFTKPRIIEVNGRLSPKLAMIEALACDGDAIVIAYTFPDAPSQLIVTTDLKTWTSFGTAQLGYHITNLIFSQGHWYVIGDVKGETSIIKGSVKTFPTDIDWTMEMKDSIIGYLELV